MMNSQEQTEYLLWKLVIDIEDVLGTIPISELWSYLLEHLSEETANNLHSYMTSRYDTGWIYKTGMEYLKEQMEAK